MDKTNTTALVWWRIRHSELARSKSGAPLRDTYVNQAVLAARGTHRVYRFVSALQNQGIDPVLFKGWTLLPHYAEAGLRPMGDVDMAVNPAELESAREIMRQLGAGMYDVDIHSGLADPDHAAYIPGALWEEVLARTRTRMLGDIQVRVLAPEDELQMLCIHSMRHLAARPIWLCDIAAALEDRPADLDWTHVLSKPPYASWILYGLLLAHRLLGAEVADTPLAERVKELPEWLVQDVLARWGEEPTSQPKVYDSILSVWRSPSRWQDAVRVRIPNRFAAAIDHHGALDDPLVARHQMRAMLVRLRRFRGRNL